MTQSDESWWRYGIFYQIYPRSFRDSNADGVGDIAGIIDRLPYLQELGVDAVWLSPIFPSPMADFGYDISDYTGIDPLFGTMADFDALISAVHENGLKLILDLVPNHTSDQHPWFLASRSAREDHMRDWYIWREPAADGGPPNNWMSEFGGCAWEYDAATGQYYYHAFLAQQPDLNWRNPEVRQAIYDVMRFWLRKGVDGFRVDVIWHLIKDAAFRDNPPNPNYREGRPPHEKILTQYSADQPEVHEVIAEMRQVIDEFDARVLIGEIYLPLHRLVAYYGNDLAGAQMPFNFALLSTLWSARSIEQIVADYEKALPAGAWPNWVLGNHDRPRVASRVGAAQARSGAGRDGCRTPMQWDATPYAGFSTSAPWLPLPDDFLQENVTNLDADAQSILSLYRDLIALRKRLPHLMVGDYVPMAAEGDLLLYRRQSEENAVVVALNLGAEPVSIASETIGLDGEILLSTFLDREGEKIDGTLDLRGNEGVIVG